MNLNILIMLLVWRHGKMKVDKKDYQDLLDCIQSDQVSAPEIAEYFEDEGFYKFYKENQKPVKRNSDDWLKGYKKWKNEKR